MRMGAAALLMVLLLAACGQSAVTAGEVRSDTPGEAAVDFFQDGDRVGHLFARVQSTEKTDLVRFFVEVPIVADEDYRLDSLTLEFVSDAIQPLIMLEPSNGSLTQDIDFFRVDSAVRLAVPDTGHAGDGTVLFNFLANTEAFGENGLRLHAKLKFGAGEGEAALVIQPAF